MNTLALDTTSDRLSVAARRPAGRVSVREATGARQHAGLLVPLVLEVLAEAGLDPGEVTRLIVADGPGGFTGLRVAAAWIKGFSRDRNVVVRAVSTLLVRAAAARAPGRVVLGVASALRGELYVAGYQFGAAGVSTVLEPMVLASGHRPPLEGPVDAIVGDVADEVVRGWGYSAAVVIGGPQGLPDAARMLELADLAGATVPVEDIGRWEPIYGRPAEAQAKWERIHGRTLPNPASQPG